MTSSPTPRISIVGAGNVATRLALAFRRAGCTIATVAARTPQSAAALAARVDAEPVAVDDTDTEADIVVIAVSDRAVADVAARLRSGSALLAHTSGSTPLSDVARHWPRAAVLYPLQTFSRDVEVDIARVPFFTEATCAADLEAVDAIARLLSANVYHADSRQRSALHVAGVLTSNFPVYLLEVARQKLAEAGFPLEVVHPLAEATIAKAFAVGPLDALTGPARRGDTAVTCAHAESLTGDAKKVYETITEAITRLYE